MVVKCKNSNVLSVAAQTLANEVNSRKVPLAFIMLQLLLIGPILLLFSSQVEAWDSSNGK